MHLKIKLCQIHRHVMALVPAYVRLLAQMVVKENVKVVKVVVRMAVKLHVVAGVAKDVKAVATRCVKVTV